MTGRRRITFPGWMPGLYRKVGKRVTTYYALTPAYVGLGNDIAKARAQLIALEGDAPPVPGTVAVMLDEELARRRVRVAKGKLAASTFAGNLLEAEQLKKPFGRMRPEDVKKKHIYDYLHTYRGAQAPVRANREIAFLQSAFKPLVATDVLASNPCVGVERNEEHPRSRQVSPGELAAFLDFARRNGHITSASKEAQWARENQDAGARVANAAELSYLTTKAQGEVIKLTRTRLIAEGIEWPGRKGGAPTITEWTPRLREVVANCLAMPSPIESVYVIFNREGQPYTSAGFKSVWGKIMHAWGELRNARFTFHDSGRARGITKLREKGRKASEVSGHMQEKTIAVIYDRRTFRKAPAVE